MTRTPLHSPAPAPVRVLALDLGTRTGWALWDGTRVESGVQAFDLKRGESPGMRYLRFNWWLGEITDPIRGARSMVIDPAREVSRENREFRAPPLLGLIIYEQVLGRFASGGSQTEIATGFATRVMEYCAGLGALHTNLPATTLKKWTTGKGNAKKPEMIAAVLRRGFAPHYVPSVKLDDNEADALALLAYARAEILAP